MKIWIGLLCDWTVLSLKIKNVTAAVWRRVTTLLIRREPFVMNGKYNPNRKKTSFIWQFLFFFFFAEHFLISVLSTPAATHTAAGLTYWLRCQQHFITLKHNIAVSRHFRIHLLSLSDVSCQKYNLTPGEILHCAASTAVSLYIQPLPRNLVTASAFGIFFLTLSAFSRHRLDLMCLQFVF